MEVFSSLPQREQVLVTESGAYTSGLAQTPQLFTEAMVGDFILFIDSLYLSVIRTSNYSLALQEVNFKNNCWYRYLRRVIVIDTQIQLII